MSAWSRLHQSQSGKAVSYRQHRMPVRQAEALVNDVVAQTRQELQGGLSGEVLPNGLKHSSELQGAGNKETVQRGWEHRPLAQRLDQVVGPEGEILCESVTNVFESNGVKVFQQISQTPQGTCSRQFDFHFVGESGQVSVQEWFTPA